MRGRFCPAEQFLDRSDLHFGGSKLRAVANLRIDEGGHTSRRREPGRTGNNWIELPSFRIERVPAQEVG
jgi:hypothetical protein